MNYVKELEKRTSAVSNLQDKIAVEQGKVAEVLKAVANDIVVTNESTAQKVQSLEEARASRVAELEQLLSTY